MKGVDITSRSLWFLLVEMSNLFRLNIAIANISTPPALAVIC